MEIYEGSWLDFHTGTDYSKCHCKYLIFNHTSDSLTILECFTGVNRIQESTFIGFVLYCIKYTEAVQCVYKLVAIALRNHILTVFSHNYVHIRLHKAVIEYFE